jgi:hypothetical protein
LQLLKCDKMRTKIQRLGVKLIQKHLNMNQTDLAAFLVVGAPRLAKFRKVNTVSSYGWKYLGFRLELYFTHCSLNKTPLASFSSKPSSADYFLSRRSRAIQSVAYACASSF